MANIRVVHRKLGRHRAYGRALFEERIIEIDSRMEGIDHLDTVIHEVMHLQNNCSFENKISQDATELSIILWDLGYRRE